MCFLVKASYINLKSVTYYYSFPKWIIVSHFCSVAYLKVKVINIKYSRQGESPVGNLAASDKANEARTKATILSILRKK